MRSKVELMKLYLDRGITSYLSFKSNVSLRIKYRFIKLFSIKRTAGVISSDPPWKNGNDRFTT